MFEWSVDFYFFFCFLLFLAFEYLLLFFFQKETEMCWKLESYLHSSTLSLYIFSFYMSNEIYKCMYLEYKSIIRK